MDLSLGRSALRRRGTTSDRPRNDSDKASLITQYLSGNQAFQGVSFQDNHVKAKCKIGTSMMIWVLLSHTDATNGNALPSSRSVSELRSRAQWWCN